MPSGNIDDVHKPHFLEVDLNNQARVFIVLKTRRVKDLSKVLSVQGLDSSWKNLLAVSSATAGDISVGGSSRSDYQVFPEQAIVLEKELQLGETLILPHPQSILLNDEYKVAQYYLLFARITPRSVTPVAFSYPNSPGQVTRLSNGKTIEVKAVIPNEKCPFWLHELYRAPARPDGNKAGALVFWHTWHPIVDPVFWCYFDHEHGSYPGNYRPPFDYTAFKTNDPETEHRRQIELDSGFKVFSIPLPKQQRHLILTVHMQGSSSRRFPTQFHTGIFTVFDKNWNLELELFMKMDFGAAVASLKNRTMVPIDRNSARIYE